MKKIIILALLANALCLSAQKAETIHSIAAVSHEADWYAEQAKAWQAEVEKNPKNEWAWRNLFRATFYHDKMTSGFGEDQDQSATAEVMRGMEKAIPDSYTINLSKQRFCLSTDTITQQQKTLYRAIKQLPDNAEADDVDNLACRLWLNDMDNPDVSRLMTIAYKKNAVPDPIMRYNWNMMQSMKQNAIYIGNGDNILIPGRMMQDALGVRKDVTFIPLPYLYEPKYQDKLWKALGIEPFESTKDYSTFGDEWTKEYLADIILHIIHKTGRPTYFFIDVLTHTNLSQDSLYNEGLLLKYSDRKYDNIAVAMKNVKEVYHLEYLTEPQLTYSFWDSCDKMNLNYSLLLGQLVKRFTKKGDEETAKRLFNILYDSIQMSHADDERKQYMTKYLEAQAGMTK